MGVKLSQEEFNTRVLLVNNNIDIIGEYLGDKKDIQFHCGKHDKWFVKKPGTFLGKKALGCSLCGWENGIGGKKYDDFDRKYITKQCNDYEFVEHIDGKNGGNIVYICPKHRDKGCQTVKWDQISSGKAMCHYCYIENMTGTHDDFVNRMDSINSNIIIESKYKKATIHVKCECLVCGNQWKAMPYNLLNGYGCPVCSAKCGGEKQRLSYEDKIEKLESYHKDIDFLEIPELSHGYVQCRCKNVVKNGKRHTLILQTQENELVVHIVISLKVKN